MSSRKSNTNGDRLFRTEWRVTSQHRPPRTETYDINFPPGQEVHRHLSRKLEHAEEQLKRHTLRFGDELELSKVYFIGRN
jgi:hypothetical protein